MSYVHDVMGLDLGNWSSWTTNRSTTPLFLTQTIRILSHTIHFIPPQPQIRPILTVKRPVSCKTHQTCHLVPIVSEECLPELYMCRDRESFLWRE